jgi:hypothetical protein
VECVCIHLGMRDHGYLGVFLSWKMDSLLVFQSEIVFRFVRSFSSCEVPLVTPF